MKTITALLTDVLIVGGGPAGLSCALSLARGGRSLILCDDKRPRNKNVDAIRNLPGHEGMSPADYRSMLKQSLCTYDQISLKDVSVISIKRGDGVFISSLSNGESVCSKRVVLAEGLVDILPEIKGLEEMWGKFVFHCPYCHGYENVGREFGVLASNKKAIQLIRLLRGLTDNISVFTNDQEIFNEYEMLEFRNSDMRVFTGKIDQLSIINSKLNGVMLENNELVKCNTLFVQNEVRPRSSLGIELGCKIGEGGIYEVTPEGESSQKGVYCAGDVGSKSHSVIMATAVGSHVGICVNADLLRGIFRKELEDAN